MDKKTMKQMAKMVDAVQPHCDEEIVAAMTCSHAGSMSSVLVSKLMGGIGGGMKSSDLPNPVFIAVGQNRFTLSIMHPRDSSSRLRRKFCAGPRTRSV